MANEDKILACKDASGEYWQLGNLLQFRGKFLLIGWKVYPEPVDGGVPAGVVAILSKAFTSVARITFPHSSVEGVRLSESDRAASDTATITLDDKNPLKSAFKQVFGTPNSREMLSTTDSGVAENLFDDDYYHWVMQGQFAALSDKKVVPKIDGEIFELLFNDISALKINELLNDGIKALLRPGVDGAIAGILFLDEFLEDEFLVSLSAESAIAGFEFELLDEEEFAAGLADN
jgi:hypothetical protein